MINYVISGNLLGRGAYSNVYPVDGKPYAIKICKMDKEHGIPHLLELSIMTTISHPYLNKAISIYANFDNLYIIQDLAISDLARYTRSNKIELNRIKFWCKCLISAISTLHNNNIIHADIKANNVLLFADDLIKLADFTLAVKKRYKNEQFTHNTCTATHRPLEVFKEQLWNESVDIWSLGCTLYEITYGELLFSYQEHDDREKRKKLYINNIKNFNPNNVKLNPEFNELNDLIFSMLIIDHKNRPTIKMLSKCNFLKTSYKLIKCKLRKLSAEEKIQFINDIQFISEKYIIKLALDIYSRLPKVNDEKLTAITCAWIAHKLIYDIPPDVCSNMTQLILEKEIEICHNMNFYLSVL